MPTIQKGLPKISTYMKNVGKSLVYASVDVIKTDLPTVGAFLDNESNKEVAKIVYSNIKDLQSLRLLGRNTAIALRRSKIWEAGELATKSALEDIRTGKFYNKDRISEIEDQVLEDTFGGWDDMDLDMDEDGNSVGVPTRGDKLISASAQIAASKAADQISETTIATTGALLAQHKQATELNYAQNFKLATELRMTMTNIGNKTNVYLENIQSLNQTIAENNKKFFETTSKILQENNAMMKEMLTMQQNLYKRQADIDKQKEKERLRKKPGFNDVVSQEGIPDVREYGKMVKNKAYSQLDEMSGGMLGVLLGGTTGTGDAGLLKQFAASPLQFLTESMIGSLIPKNVRKSSKKLDATLGGVFPTMIANLNKNAKNLDNPLAAMLGKVLGIDTRIKDRIDTSKYEKGPMQWNGIAQKAQTEVIPELLSDILSVLSGQPKKYYDFDKGRWTTGRAVKSEYDNMKKSSISSSFSDLTSEMAKFFKSGKGSKFSSRSQMQNFQDTLEIFLRVLYENDGSFNAKKDYDIYQSAGISKSDYDLISAMISNIGKDNHSIRMGLAANVMSNKQSYNSRIKQLQDQGGGVFNYLFNKPDANKIYKTPKFEEKPIGFGSDLNKILDEKGHNVFYYLQEITAQLYQINKFGGGGGSPNAARARLNPFRNVYDQTPVRDVHKETAAERYSKDNINKDIRYQNMVEEHTKRGGLLYDLVDDKGNINLVNATAEQQRIAEQIRQYQETSGFLQDTLFGPSKLDQMNSRRSINGEQQIDQKRLGDRLKQARTLEEKYKVLTDMTKRGVKGVPNVTSNIISRADDEIYKFFFGDETGETDGNNKSIRGFMNLMSSKLNSTLDKGIGFMEDKILGPLRNKLGTDSLKDWFLEKTHLKDLFEGVHNYLTGEDGLLTKIKDETKTLFKSAGGFVKNAFGTVFGPTVDKVKNKWKQWTTSGNKIEDRDVNLDDLQRFGDLPGAGDLIRANTAKKGLPRTLIALGSLGPEGSRFKAAITANPNNLKTIESALSYVNKYQIPNDLNDKQNARLKLAINNARIGLIAQKSKLMRQSKITSSNSISRTSPIQDDILDPNEQELIRQEAETDYKHYGKDVSRDIRRREGTEGFLQQNQKIIKFAINILNKFGVSTDFKDPVVAILMDVVNDAPGRTQKEKMSAMTKIDTTTLYDRLMEIGTPKAIRIAQAIERVMLTKGKNINRTLGSIHSKGFDIPDNTGGHSSINNEMMSKMLSCVEDIKNMLDTVVDKGAKAVRSIIQRPLPRNPLPPRINNRNSNGREPESEGDSTGDDGDVHSAAFGAKFKKNTVSALSEGEIYGKNGLYGKIPKTGVYDVKAGTTIIPTKKDKAVELANEQDVINRLIYSNADAKGRRTRQFNGLTYTEVSPDNWIAFYQDDQGRQRIKEATTDSFGLASNTGETLRSGANMLSSRLGLGAQFGAVKMPTNLNEAKELVSKYVPKMSAGALLGAAVGLLAGNPLLGAAIGGTSMFVSASDQAKDFLFGEKAKDEEGNEVRTGGVISTSVQDAVKKYFPKMSSYATVGAGLGLLSPFGLVGGALIGSAMGWAGSNDAVREALFGKSDDPKSGLMSKETREKLTKAMPNIAAGALIGVFTGPFGILGNALIGSGIGLASTTNTFKDFVLGTEKVNPDGSVTREGGLVGSIKEHVVDPLKEFGGFFKNKMEDMFINGIINPIKESIKPLTKDMMMLGKAMFKAIPNMIDTMFSSTFGRPLTQLIDEKIISPISRVTNAVAKGAVNIGAGIVSAPFKAVRGIARSRQMSHIKTGNADYMTAKERLQFRKDHKVRAGFGDDYTSTDEIMNLMDEGQLKATLESMKQLQSTSKLKKEERAAGRNLSAEVTKYFGTKGSTWRMFKSAMNSNDLEGFSRLLDTTPTKDGSMLTKSQKDALMKLAEANMSAVDINRRKQNLTKDKEKILFRDLRAKGFNVNSKNVGKMTSLLEHEYVYKKSAKKEETPEQSAADSVIESAAQNTKEVVSAIENGVAAIVDILNKSPEDMPETERVKSNRSFVNRYFHGQEEQGPGTQLATQEQLRNAELERAQREARERIEEQSNRSPFRRGRRTPNEDGSVPATVGAVLRSKINNKMIMIRNYADAVSTDTGMLSTGNDEMGFLSQLAGRGLGNAKKLSNKVKGAFNEELEKTDKKTKEVFDPAANAFRTFRRGMSGEWVEVNGKVKDVANKNEEINQDSQMVRLGNTIGNAIHGVFGGVDKETGEKKEGLLSKLFGTLKGPVGKIAKAAGIGLLGATIVAGLGHGSDWLFPKIEDTWTNHMKPWLNETFKGLGDKLVNVKDTIFALPGQIFNWFAGNTESGGLPSLFTDKILPWYLEGFGAFAQNFLEPLVSVFVKTLPKAILAIGKGILGGINGIFHNEDKWQTDFDSMNKEVSGKVDTRGYKKKTNLSKIPKAGTSGWFHESPSGDGAFNLLDSLFQGGVSGTQGKTKTQRGKDSKSYQEIINDPNATDHEKQEAIAAASANASEYGPNGEILYNHEYMLKDKNGNTIMANGEVAKDNANRIFNPFDGVASTQDRLFKGGIRRILSPGSSNGLLKLMSTGGELMTKMPGHGLVSGITKGAGGMLRTAGNAGQAALGVSDRLMSGFAGSNLGSIAYSLGGRGTMARAGRDALLESGIEGSLTRGLANVGDEIIGETGTKFVIKATQEGGHTITREVAEGAGKTASKGLIGKIQKAIKEGMERIFKSDIVQSMAEKGMRMVGKVTENGAVKAALEKVSNSVVGKLCKEASSRIARASTTAMAKISAAIGTAGIATLAFSAWDFATGFKDAHSILGITKDQDISWTERFIAGLLKCVNGFILWGLIPESFIVDVFIDHVAPIFGVDVDDLKQRRQASDQQMKDINAELGTSYSIEEWNKKDSFGTKVKSAIFGANENQVIEFNAANGTNLTVEEYNATHGLKGVANKVFKGVEPIAKAFMSTMGGIIEGVKEGNPLKVMQAGPKLDSKESIGTNIANQMLTNSLKTVGVPIAAVVGAGKILGKALKPVFEGIKKIAPTVMEKIKTTTSCIFDGDVLGFLRSSFDFKAEGGGVDVGKVVGSLVSGALGTITFPIALITKGLKIFTTPVDELFAGLKRDGTELLNTFGRTGSYILNGDVAGLTQNTFTTISDTGADGNRSTGKLIGEVLTKAMYPVTFVPTAVIGVGKMIGKGIMAMVDGLIKNKDVLNKNQHNLLELANAGKLAELLQYEADTGDEGNPLAFLHTGMTFVSKFIHIPIAAFRAIKDNIGDLIGSDSKVVKIGDLVDEMKEYFSKKKHPTMDGFKDIGKEYTEEKGPAGIVNGLIVNMATGIGKHIVNIARMFSGIKDLIDKIPGIDFDDEEISSGTGKFGRYGRGRVSQLDPRVSKIPFNSPSDSKKQTIGNSGCGPAAAVNAASYAYGTGPDDLVEASKYAINGGYKERNGGTKPGFFSSYLNRKGLKANRIGNTAIPREVQSGHPVILMGKDPNGEDTPYGSNPHYVVAKGMDGNGNIIIDDPESMNPSMKYPAGKVLSKTSMAIKAAPKYGMGLDYQLNTIYWPNGSFSVLDPALLISPNDVYKTKEKAGEDSTKVSVFKGIGGVGSHSEQYMKLNTLSKIGYPLTKSRSEAKTMESNSGKLLFDTAKTVGSNIRVPQSEKNRAIFSTIGWLNKPFNALMTKGSAKDTTVINTIFLRYKITVSASDMNSTVETILKKYIGATNAGSLTSFANEIGPYVDFTLDQLKQQKPSLYNSLNGYSTVNGEALSKFNTASVTVGTVCSKFNLTFEGEKPAPATYAGTKTNPKSNSDPSGDSTIAPTEYSNVDEQIALSASGDTTNSQEPSSIFDKFRSSFLKMFDFTDKSGNKSNLLSIFGITSEASPTATQGSDSIATTGALMAGGAQATGVSGEMANNFPYYDQSDPRWGQTPYGSSGTISSSGCGPTSMAMILKSFANQLTPVDTAAYSAKKGFRIPGSGTSWSFFKNIGQQFGVNTKQIGPNKSTMISSLKSGQPVISSMKPGDFTKGGHFIVLSGIDNSGNILVNDPAGSKGRARSAKSWSPDTIVNQSKQMWIFDKNGKGSIGSIATVASAVGSSAAIDNPTPTDIEANKATIWKFLKSKGYTDVAAAGIMGNIGQECGFNYSLTQKGASNPGLGICQWTYKTRKAAFLAAVPDWERNLPGQLNFMWNEINSGYRGCLPESMNKCATVKDAVLKFHEIYEGSADATMAKRNNYGSQVYSQFASGAVTTYATGKHGLGVVENGSITSRFNDPTRVSHSGVDIGAKNGTAVKSPVSGTVIRAEENAENGKMVVIQDDAGKLYTFAHLSKYNVKPNTRVAPNTIIGSVGSTGNSSGNHLHYQMTDSDGQFIDPVASAMGKQPIYATGGNRNKRAIGGLNGIDYTSFLNNIVQLLAIIGTNTEKINALVDAMGKFGMDVSGIDTSSNEAKLNSIKSSLSGNMSKSDQAQSISTELNGQRLEKLTNVMRTIAAQ